MSSKGMVSRTSAEAKKRSWLFRSPNAMARWARHFAAQLQPGDVIALVGPLGAGKTTLVKAVTAALGCRQGVSSPTFALANEYQTRRGPVYHMDMYRLSSSELEQFPLEDYWGDGICLIEWADKVRDRWPDQTQELRLFIESETTRRLEIAKR